MGEVRLIGSYEVIRLLGTGGMSEVYEVTNPRLGSRHALKLFAAANGDADVRERFQKEGRLLARLDHPRIVRVTDVGTDEASGRPFFVMDLVLNGQGKPQTLADIEQGSLDEGQIGRLYDDLREGLAYIHANGIVHRDLKLQNVLIGPDGRAVLTDFGISKVSGAKGDGTAAVEAVKTLARVCEGKRLVMGSIGYMAPELEMGVAASPQSDWYALGVIVFRLLTGTWCDARTDIVALLEGYDPVWTRLVPKLLHANPQGRACLSYEAEKGAERQRDERALVSRLESSQRRGRAVLLLVCGLSVAVAALTVTLVGQKRAERRETRLALAGRGRALCDFDELFRIPSEAKDFPLYDEKTEDVILPSRDDLVRTRTDLLVATHEDLSAVNAGRLSIEEFIRRLEELKEGLSSEAVLPYEWPEGYLTRGDDKTACWMLEAAILRLQEKSAE